MLEEAQRIELKQNRGVVRRPTSRRRLNPFEAHLGQIERIDKYVDHANGIKRFAGRGPSLRELGRQAAGHVERILNGAQAGELPFQGPTHFDFAINMRTAKALGLTIPPSLLVGADELIE